MKKYVITYKGAKTKIKAKSKDKAILKFVCKKMQNPKFDIIKKADITIKRKG